MAGKVDRLSPFSVVLIMAALSLVGLLSLPRLNVQYLPNNEGRSLSVAYSYPDASSEVVESEATSKIEGALAQLSSVTDISSISGKGAGRVSVSFRKGTDMAAARFEVASAIRNVRSSLPKSISYPVVSMSEGRSRSNLAYNVNGALPSSELASYLRDHVVGRLSSVPGVDRVDVSGGEPYQWTITFDADKAREAGVTSDDIAVAFNSYYGSSILGMAGSDSLRMRVMLREDSTEDFGAIPVKNSEGRVIHLADLATWRYEESEPSYYFRINGLNTVNLVVGISSTSNLLFTASAVRSTMEEIKKSFPPQISASLQYDASNYVSGEISRVLKRTLFCVLILLLFVFLTTFSWKYLLMVVSTLAVNILTALAIYSFFGVPIHIYTLAGITVSLGIVIDTTIVMIDHYASFRDRKAFPAVLSAVATTIGALLMVLLLPDEEKVNLSDFIWVIITGLALSLLVTYLFIPALMEYVSPGGSSRLMSVRRRRRIVRRNLRYGRYIGWGVRHRWVYVLVFIIAFGIPLCVLPQPLEERERPAASKSRLFVDKIVSWKPYAENRYVLDRFLGSSFGAFYRALDRSNFYRQPQEKELRISAGMLEGTTVHQLNDVMRAMENYLSQFDGISTFITSIYDYDDGSITVRFKPEVADTDFPAQLKAEVTRMAINFGGANWTVSGIDDNYFNNNIVTNQKSNRIALSGYNYAQLREYAEVLLDYLSKSKRVKDPEIWSGGWYGYPTTEFVLDYDFERMNAAGVNPYLFYGALTQPLCEYPVGGREMESGVVSVVLKSSDLEKHDLWHVLNSPVGIGDREVTLSEFGSITKKKSGIDIVRVNQSYEIYVCYDFLGSFELERRHTAAAIKYMNGEILPVGFKARSGWGGWQEGARQRYAWLIFLIIAVIYMILAMTFESFRYPLPVIFMIPVSFIGLFLVFGLSDLSFDQGGFAALVMLSGLVVNAGIYLVTTYQDLLSQHGCRSGVRLYVKAFSRKITPILLTVVSTVLGLIPFLSDGPEEVFWFDFAIGTICGMCLSVVAIWLVLPVFTVKNH